MCLIRGYSYKPEKEDGGMKAVYYPRGVWLRYAFLTVLATILYYLLHILTLPLGSRKEASKRQRQPIDEKKAETRMKMIYLVSPSISFSSLAWIARPSRRSGVYG